MQTDFSWWTFCIPGCNGIIPFYTEPCHNERIQTKTPINSVSGLYPTCLTHTYNVLIKLDESVEVLKLKQTTPEAVDSFSHMICVEKKAD